MGGKHKYNPETKNEVESPAVKYVRLERAKKNKDGKNQDELDSEIIQNTSKAEGVAIPQGGYVYYNAIHQQKIYMTEKEILKLSEALVKWALNDPEALKITLFFNDRGITWQVCRDWRDRFQVFAAAWDLAMQAIGDRRELGAIKRELSEGLVKYTLPIYDKAIRDMEFEKAVLRLKAEEEQDRDNRTKYIFMPVIPETALVKEIPDENKTEE